MNAFQSFIRKKTSKVYYNMTTSTCSASFCMTYSLFFKITPFVFILLHNYFSCRPRMPSKFTTANFHSLEIQFISSLRIYLFLQVHFHVLFHMHMLYLVCALITACISYFCIICRSAFLILHARAMSLLICIFTALHTSHT